MSAPLSPTVFSRDVQALPATQQAQMDLAMQLMLSTKDVQTSPKVAREMTELALRLMLSLSLPRKTSVYRNPDPLDIEARIKSFQLVHDAYVDFMGKLFTDMNDGLPVNATVDTTDFFSALSDLKSDVIWGMECAQSRIVERE